MLCYNAPMKNWISIKNTSLDPVHNLSLEAYLFEKVRDRDIFMLWRNDRSVIIGKNQIAEEEVDLAYAKEKKIRVVRRSTGGGAVYHDRGNVNYSFISDRDLSAPVDLRALAQPIVSAFLEMGLRASFSGRNDILVNGLKVCGTAERIDGGRILSHGCICFDVDLDTMTRVLTPPAEKLERHGVASVKSRVIRLRNLLPSWTTEEFMERLSAAVLRDCGVTQLAPDQLSPPFSLEKLAPLASAPAAIL